VLEQINDNSHSELVVAPVTTDICRSFARPPAFLSLDSDLDG
jgi:hypothetical protein